MKRAGRAKGGITEWALGGLSICSITIYSGPRPGSAQSEQVVNAGRAGLPQRTSIRIPTGGRTSLNSRTTYGGGPRIMNRHQHIVRKTIPFFSLTVP